MPKAQTGMAGGKSHPNTDDMNLVKRHDINSAINKQAAQMQQAITNHKRREELVREMREITQTLILETVPAVRRRKPLASISKAR